MQQVLTDSVELVSSDDKWRIYFNPVAVRALSVETLSGLIRREAIRCLRNEPRILNSSVEFDNEAKVTPERQNNIRRFRALYLVNKENKSMASDVEWAKEFLASQPPMSALEENFSKNKGNMVELELLAWTSPEVISEVEAMLTDVDTLVYPKNREKFLALGLVSIVKALKVDTDAQHEIHKKAFEATVGSSELDLIVFLGYRIMQYRRSRYWMVNKESLKQIAPVMKLIHFLKNE